MTSLSPSVIQIADALLGVESACNAAMATVTSAYAADTPAVSRFLDPDDVNGNLNQLLLNTAHLRALLAYVRTIDAPPA